MKYIRILMALGLLGAAACSSPTEPRLPSPDPDNDDDKDPDKPGVVAIVEWRGIDGVSFDVPG